MPHTHPPKIETFDLDRMTNIDPKGNERAVDVYRVEPFGLYLARRVVGHHEYTYLQSWLLPDLGLRVTHWSLRPGRIRHHDFYLDVAKVEPGPHVWRTEDHYLDILVHTGRDVEVVDTDELLAALREGLIDEATATGALETAYRAVEGITRHGYDVQSWLASTSKRASLLTFTTSIPA